MDLQTFINFGGGVALSVVGWFARQLWEAVQELRRDLAKLREELPQTYQTKDDFKDAVESLRSEMRENFSRLFDRLDRKADKP